MDQISLSRSLSSLFTFINLHPFLFSELLMKRKHVQICHLMSFYVCCCKIILQHENFRKQGGVGGVRCRCEFHTRKTCTPKNEVKSHSMMANKFHHKTITSRIFPSFSCSARSQYLLHKFPALPQQRIELSHFSPTFHSLFFCFFHFFEL